MSPRVQQERAVRVFADSLAAGTDEVGGAGDASTGEPGAAPEPEASGNDPGPTLSSAPQAPDAPGSGPKPSQTSRRASAREAKLSRLIGMFPRFGVQLERGELTVEHVLALGDVRNRVVARQRETELLAAALAHTAEDFAGWLRMWDAETDLGLSPDVGAQQRRKRYLTFFDTGNDLGEIRAALTPADYDAFKRTLLRIDAELREIEGCEPATWKQRMADALIEMMHRANTTRTSASGTSGAGGSLRTAVVVLIDLDDLLNATGHGTTADGMPVDVGEVRRMAADAHIIPVVLGSDSVPLEMGRAVRYAKDTQWLAALIRDGGCALCNSPLGVLDAHHSVTWALGGCTDLCRLALLCRHCHRRVHTEQITLKVTNGQVSATARDGTPLPTYNRLNRRPPPPGMPPGGPG